MLANVLPSVQRSERSFSTDSELANFSNNMQRLHKTDEAVIHYFGMDRNALLCSLQTPANTSITSDLAIASLAVLRNKIAVLDSIDSRAALPAKKPDKFHWFAYRFYLYFIETFKKDDRYPSASPHIQEPMLLASLESFVSARIIQTAEQSLVHYLNTQIAQGQAVELDQFNQSLRTLQFSRYFEIYPVLAHLLFEQLEDALDYLFRVIAHFAADKQSLHTQFSIAGDEIGAIEFGMGDPHGRGETVCRVHVGAISLIYKPRACRESLFFNRLLGALHQLTGAECFSVYSPKMLSGEKHSWVEALENLPCANPAEVELFYRKSAAQIAVIHALNGIDFHHENIIARGSHPVMIDLECLFTAPISDLLYDLPADSALFKAFTQTRQSVFSSGFVPFAQGSGNDLSGLTRQQQFFSSVRSLVHENGFYHLRKTTLERSLAQHHLPLLDGERKGLEAYQDAFFGSFELAYDALMTHRQTVVQMLEHAAPQLNSRVLLKNTQRYADFIGLSRHPRFMQNMLDRELLLATLWSDSKPPYVTAGIPRHEIFDLQRLSIPCFTLPLTAAHLVSAHGEIIELPEVVTPLESCLGKIRSLCPADKVLQRSILQTCLLPTQNDLQPMNLKHVHGQTAQSDRLERVVAIAARIEALAVKNAGPDIRWLSFQTHPVTLRKYLAPMGNGLYSGIAGVGLFYLSLYKVSRLPAHLACTDQVLNSLAQSHGYFKGDSSVSAFHGLGAYLYLLLNREQITGEKTCSETLESLLGKIIDVPLEDYDFDFLSGCCGAVTLLANVYALQPREDLMAVIRRMVDYLKNELITEDDRLVRRSDRSVILTGLSHGLSGVIHALCKAFEVTGDTALVRLATQVLEHENRLTADGFWLDLRNQEGPGHLSKWCHGDGGVLIARRQLLQSMGDALDAPTRQRVQADIAKCASNLWHHGLGSGYSLCHGDFGNLLCLYDLSLAANDQQSSANVQHAFEQVAENFFAGDFLSAEQIPDISLLTGIAGVGYALLYAIDPTIPKVLSLDFSVSVSAT
jgi:type 2 lantibiotic biosynthesis protein LanM